VPGALALAALVASVPIVLSLLAAAGGAVTLATASAAGHAGDVSTAALERIDRWLHGDLCVRVEDLGAASALLADPAAGGPGGAAYGRAAAALAVRALAAETARLL
jgi:hypothetical protein